MTSVPMFETPPAGVTWHILDVMRKGKGRRNDWTALLISVSRTEHKREDDWHKRQSFRECWLDIGKVKSRDLAWDIAESRISTRH